MRVLLLRVIAAAMMTVIMGLPIARVVCAHECWSVAEAATVPAGGEDCHRPDATGSTTLTSVELEGCGPFLLSSVATRERASAPPVVSIELPDLPTRTPNHPDLYLRGDATRPPAATAGLFPGASRPLRI